jgi:hypothetical protein
MEKRYGEAPQRSPCCAASTCHDWKIFIRPLSHRGSQPLILCLSKPTTGSAAAGRIAEEAALGHALGEEAAAVGYELREAREEASGVGHASMD